jgi:hypothetical protein
MSDQNTDTDQENNGPEAALDIEIVSVQQAEEEAAAARAKVDPEEVLMEQGLVDEMSTVLNQLDPKEEAESKVELGAESSGLEKPKQPKLQAKVKKVAEDDDVVLFDEAPDDQEEQQPVVVESTVELQNMEGLTEIVLDAASAANEAAHSTNQSIHMLLSSVTTINKMAKKLRKTNNYVLGLIVSLGLVGILSGAVMLFVLQSAIKEATAVNMAMGTKLVEFEKQMDRVNLIEAQLIDVADVSHQLGQSVEQVMYYLKQVGTDSQQAATQQATENQLMLGSVNEQILSSFNDLQSTTKVQQGVLIQLKSRIDSLQVQMKTIQNQDLVGKVKALIALEQERYFALEQAKLALETAKRADSAPPVEDSFITFGVKSE